MVFIWRESKNKNDSLNIRAILKALLIKNILFLKKKHMSSTVLIPKHDCFIPFLFGWRQLVCPVLVERHDSYTRLFLLGHGSFTAIEGFTTMCLRMSVYLPTLFPHYAYTISTSGNGAFLWSNDH